MVREDENWHTTGRPMRAAHLFIPLPCRLTKKSMQPTGCEACLGPTGESAMAAHSRLSRQGKHSRDACVRWGLPVVPAALSALLMAARRRPHSSPIPPAPRIGASSSRSSIMLQSLSLESRRSALPGSTPTARRCGQRPGPSPPALSGAAALMPCSRAAQSVTAALGTKGRRAFGQQPAVRSSFRRGRSPGDVFTAGQLQATRQWMRTREAFGTQTARQQQQQRPAVTARCMSPDARCVPPPRWPPFPCLPAT